ncbi:MAG: trimethylamine methyltransferase family protein [Anaerolineae bacterium]
MQKTEQRIFNNKLRLRMLSDAQVQAIHKASLQVLQRTGYYVPVAEARELLIAAGARVDGERVYIPEDLVDQALQTLRPVTLYNRLGEPVLPLAEGRVTFGALADTVFIRDPYTCSNRPYRKADQTWFTTLLDALPNIDYIQCVGQAVDVPDTLQTQVAVLQSMRHTSKPIWVLPYDRRGLLDVLDCLEIVAGGRAKLREQPFMICVSVPAAPLYGTRENIEVLMACAETETPVITYSCPALGGNSPYSVAGALVLSNADWLANVVMHQLKRPGAPLCTAGFTVQVMDMRSTLWSYCAPEVFLAYAAVTDLAHWYGMPAWGLELCTDSPQLDAQAGVEMMAECTFAFLSGVEMVHNAGLIGAGKLCAAEGVVLADEVIGYTKAMSIPPALDNVQLDEMVNLIAEVGPMGDYIRHPHTLGHCRDIWYPQLFDRSMFDPMPNEWNANLILQRLNVRARRLLETHSPLPLPGETLAELERLEAIWYRRASNG